MQRYLLIYKCGSAPVSTPWFEPENHWDGEVYLMVVDMAKFAYTKDGTTWTEITEDHL